MKPEVNAMGTNDKVRVVTDSGADLRSLAEELGVTVVPLKMHFGERLYVDCVDFTPQQFFKELLASTTIPRTSQPSPGDFVDVYRRLAAEGVKTIVSVHLSAKLSGTLQSAVLAKSMVPEVEVLPVDSLSASWGLGMQVIEAARAANAGKSAAEIVSLVEALSRRVHIYFTLDTLEYLQKNGRIGRAQALLGTLLSVKPILTLEDGEIAPADKVRGRSRVIPRLLEIAAEKVPPKSKVRLTVIHSMAEEEAATLKAALERQYDVVEGRVSWVGAMIGCHTGPGLLAFCMFAV
jgi:DegV family protein with EDD domain